MNITAMFVVAGLLQAQEPLDRRAATMTESALLAAVRTAPLAAREAIGEAIRRTDVTSADRLAASYRTVTGDAFPSREVERYARWNLAQRAARAQADSLRLAGVAAYSRDGARAAITIWRRALSRARALPDSALVAATLANIGAGWLREGVIDSAEVSLSAAVAWARAVGDLRTEANALVGMGGTQEERGHTAAASTHHTRALALHTQLGDTRGMAADRNNLGLLAWQAGDLDLARQHFSAALDVNQKDGRGEVAATNQVNLAALESLRGGFIEADRLYRAAIGTWRAAAAWADVADALLGLGQLELRRGDYPAARVALEEALAIFDRTGPLTSALDARQLLASTYAAQGQLQAAIDALHTATQIAEARRAGPGVRAALLLARADLAVRLNALSEAERLYTQAGQLAARANDSDLGASAQHGRGMLMLERDNLRGAQAMFEVALRTQTAAGDARSAAITRVSLALITRQQGDSAQGERQLRRAADDLIRLQDPVGAAWALSELAGMEAEAGRPAAAEALYRRAIASMEGRSSPDVTWLLHAGLAHARAARGDHAQAAVSLRRAVAEIERSGRALTLPERRSGFLSDKLDAYAQLALLEQRRGEVAAAFEISERLRAREMVELLGLGRVGAAASGWDAGEQDLRRHIAALTDELEGSVFGPLRGPTITRDGGVTREALLAAQTSYVNLLTAMRERAPRHAELVSHTPATWREVATRLQPGQVMIEYLISDSGSVAFVVTADTLAMVTLGIGRRELARLVEFARGAVESPRDSLWRGPFRRLHRYLIEPLESAGVLHGAKALILVPHGELHYLPFAALLGTSGPLVARFEIATTPSATAWLALGARTRTRGEGILALAPRIDALPGSDQELRAIERLAGEQVRTLRGRLATESQFREAAGAHRILHLATYGVLNKHNPLFSFVELSTGADDDGRLEVHEVFGLSLRADLVILSACQTGVGSGRLADVPAGDDWIGFTRAFLHAGAKAVMATLWAVDDRATAALMEEFYRQGGAQAPPATALARAQRSLLNQTATAHPFHWAGMIVTQGSSE
jgi:CHAT domain-containing protein/tetratricopeptide (TPR) repeat protein